jgi:hypothetical protein
MEEKTFMSVYSLSVVVPFKAIPMIDGIEDELIPSKS